MEFGFNGIDIHFLSTHNDVRVVCNVVRMRNLPTTRLSSFIKQLPLFYCDSLAFCQTNQLAIVVRAFYCRKNYPRWSTAIS